MWQMVAIGAFKLQTCCKAMLFEWFDLFPGPHSHASVAFCGVRSHIKFPRPFSLYAHKPLGDVFHTFIYALQHCL
jgi:hypothetical protein